MLFYIVLFSCSNCLHSYQIGTIGATLLGMCNQNTIVEIAMLTGVCIVNFNLCIIFMSLGRLVIDMSRRSGFLSIGRMSFGKKHAKQRGYNITVTPSFPLQIPLNLVSLRSTEQTNPPPFQEPLSLSISIPCDVIEQTPINFNTIHDRAKQL